MNALALLFAAACGIHFDVPKGWMVRVDHPETNVCTAGVSPRDWDELVEKARWPDGDDAVVVSVVSGTLRDAAEVADFFFDEDSGKLMANDRGGTYPPGRARYSGMPGWEFSGWSRGFAKDGADLRGDSRLTSDTFTSVLLERNAHTWIVVQYTVGNPDIPEERVGRVKAAKKILRSVR